MTCCTQWLIARRDASATAPAASLSGFGFFALALDHPTRMVSDGAKPNSCQARMSEDTTVPKAGPTLFQDREPPGLGRTATASPRFRPVY